MSTKTNANAHAIISNMDKFKIGEAYTYKDICIICKIKEYKSCSNSRNKQINTFKELFTVEETKKSRTIIYTITSKKEVTNDKVEFLIANNRGKSKGSRNNYMGVYREDLFNTMLYMCLTIATKNNLYKDNGDDFTLTMSRHDIMCEIGIRNRHNYYVANTQPNNFCYQLDVNRSVFDYVTNRINTNSYNAVKKVLDDIIKCGLAIKTDTMKIVKHGINKDGTFNKSMIISNRFATEEEFIEISNIKKSVATEMRYKNESQIHSSYNNDKKAEFYKRVNELTYKKLRISEHYPLVKLHMKKSNIEAYLKKFDNITLDELITISNKSFLNKQIKTIKSNRTKYLNSNSSTTNSKAYVQSFDDYLEQSDDIVKHLVGIFADRIELLDSDLKVNHLTDKYILTNYNNDEYEKYEYEYEYNKIPMLLKVIAEKYGVENYY